MIYQLVLALVGSSKKWTVIVRYRTPSWHAFLVLALIAAVLGFGGIAAGAASIAKILFYIFLVLFVISLIVQIARGGPR